MGKSNKHTKGPWHYSGQASNGMYCIENHDKHWNLAMAQSEADAKLIAASPELLEALEHCLADLKRCKAHFEKTRDFGVSALAEGLAEEAITKAKGGNND